MRGQKKKNAPNGAQKNIHRQINIAAVRLNRPSGPIQWKRFFWKSRTFLFKYNWGNDAKAIQVALSFVVNNTHMACLSKEAN